MAAVNINTTVQNFDDHGGIITLDDGTNVSTIKNVVPETLEVTQPMRAVKNRLDRAVQQSPRMGADGLGSIKFQCYAGSMLTGQLAALAQTQGSNGLVKTFTATIKIPGYRGSTTGEQLVTANAYFVKQPDRKGGSGEDLLDIELAYLTDGAWVSY
jgi:hypothetical protein